MYGSITKAKMLKLDTREDKHMTREVTEKSAINETCTRNGWKRHVRAIRRGAWDLVEEALQMDGEFPDDDRN